MATMKGKRVLTSLYLDPAIAEELKQLSATTRIPQAVYLREAVDLLLSHYRHVSELITKGRSDSTPINPPVLERFIRVAEKKRKTATAVAKHK